MLSKHAAKIFNDVDKYIKFTTRDDEGTLDALESQDELQTEIVEVRKNKPVAFSDKRTGTSVSTAYPFVGEPRLEADVAALFAMALARGLFPYEILRVSSHYRYDCFLQFTSERRKLVIVAEFKYLAESILADLEKAKARYGQLHLLICWSMDESKLKQAGFIVQKPQNKKREFPGITHKLSFPTSSGVKDTPIAVICLSDALARDNL